MNYKRVTLYVGSPMVALGIRLLYDNLFTNLPVALLAAAIFLIGVSIVRFEDFSQSKIVDVQVEA